MAGRSPDMCRWCPETIFLSSESPYQEMEKALYGGALYGPKHFIAGPLVGPGPLWGDPLWARALYGGTLYGAGLFMEGPFAGPGLLWGDPL